MFKRKLEKPSPRASGRKNRQGTPLSASASAKPSVSGDKTLTKGLQLLEALSQGDGSGGVSELAQQLALTKSNVHRLLQTLIRCGYVTRNAGTERYFLSSRLWRISRQGMPFAALQRRVRPLLRSVVEETDESAVFVVIENDDLVLIDQVETQNPVRVFFSIGQSFPIDEVVMMGKALTALQMVALSRWPEPRTISALGKVKRQLKADDAFVDLQMAELHAIRKNGAAYSRGGWVAGVNAVAVPVTDSAGTLIGVLSCFGPAERIPEHQLREIRKILARKAQKLSIDW